MTDPELEAAYERILAAWQRKSLEPAGSAEIVKVDSGEFLIPITGKHYRMAVHIKIRRLPLRWSAMVPCEHGPAWTKCRLCSNAYKVEWRNKRRKDADSMREVQKD